MSETLAGKRSIFTLFSLRLSEVVIWLQNARWLHRWGIPFSIFLLAFLVRAIYPISRPIVWSDRAIHFANAILEQDWATTYQRYHPGVSLMWLTGTGLQIISKLQGGITSNQLLGTEPARPGVMTQSVIAGVIPLALAIAFCIALTYPLLSRLAGRTIALVAAVFLVFDPFFIEFSKVIHPDALLSSLMIVSALFLLVYLKEGRIIWLIFSGIFTGFNLLTKTPSLYLLPYTALIVSAVAIWPQLQENEGKRGFNWKHVIWQVFRTLAIWGGIALAVFVVLWPAMWVEPVEVFNRLIDGITFHQTLPHMNPIYFAGDVYTEDPGIRFFLATILWKTTAITFPLVILGFIFAIIRFRTERAKVFWALGVYIFFFTVQMSLAEFKQMAYILPIFPALDILAAFGLVWAVEAISNLKFWRSRKWVSIILIGTVLFVNVLLVWDHFPYFGTHHNNLFGGSRVARRFLPFQDNGEGLELAARYLSQLPHGQDETATLYDRSAIVFQREFIGRTLTEFVPWATYRVYYINHLMRDIGREVWGESWAADQNEEPLMTVEFDGVTYVWVYGEIPEDPVPGKPRKAINYRLGDSIVLKGFKLSDEVISPGEPNTVVLYWQPQEEVSGDYTIFVHLLSNDGELVAQQDNVPLNGIRPTDTWLAGEELEDVYNILTPEDLPPGQYELSVGMYDSETIVRLPAFDDAGNRLAGDRIIIEQVLVE
ncbi:MAG: glycosyltransferase family 39 protein [Chloroflexota bacterium]